eukprot:2743624-Amphidinium_carterae.1
MIYEYFDERTPNLFNNRLQPQHPQPHSENEDDEEEDEDDDYDTVFGERESSRQSAGTTKTSKGYVKSKEGKGRERTIGERRPPPGSIVTNLYHAHITNFHAVAPPMTTNPYE